MFNKRRKWKNSKLKLNQIFYENEINELEKNYNFSKRVNVICGDLKKLNFGFNEIFDKLSKNIDIIFHNATMNNSLLPYSSHYDTNVFGTLQIIKLSYTLKKNFFIFQQLELLMFY